MSINNGFFIVIDSLDGAGKTSQVQLLKESLEKHGYDVIKTREPGGSPGGEELRNLLLTGPTDRWDNISELFMFTAARRNHVETLIKPALAEGKIVICDRFVPVTMAYQGYARGADLSIIETVTKIALGDFTPDLTIIFKISVEEGLRRAHQRRGTEMRFESMDMDFFNNAHRGFEELSHRNDGFLGKQVVSVDTSQLDGETPEESIERIRIQVLGLVVKAMLDVNLHNTRTFLRGKTQQVQYYDDNAFTDPPIKMNE